MSDFFNSDLWWTYIIPALTVIYILVVARVFFIILLENRNPIKTQSYLLLLVLFPVVGLVIYFYFGVSYRKEKLFSRKKINDLYLINKWREDYEQVLNDNEEELEEIFGEKIKTPRLNYSNEYSVISAYNEVDLLINGEEKFPRLIEDIKSAKHHIHLEYYIFLDGGVVDELIDLLIEKVSEGVVVRLIMDAVGSFKISNRALRKMKKGGVLVYDYMPVRIPQLANKINYRDHRKIIVIDGLIGYLGGINIDDRYVNKDSNEVFWRDTHMRIKGDAVQSLQMLFVLNWYFVSDFLIKPDEAYFPTNSVDEINLISVLGSGPDSDSKSMMEMYFSMITNARENVRIATPYFIPNESILTALKTAAKSGVTVEIMLPGQSDTKIAQKASLSFAKELMSAGVHVLIYKKGMIHAKTMVVDEEVSTVGTANFDYRSFEQNSEVNALIINEKIATEMISQFEEDKKSCQLYSWAELNNRSLWNKFSESLARLFSPLL